MTRNANRTPSIKNLLLWLAAALLAGCQSGAPRGGQSLISYEPEYIPAGVSASVRNLRQIVLVWDRPPSSAREYRIERAAFPTGPFTAIAAAPASDRRYVDQGTPAEPLGDGKTFYYRVVALLGGGRTSQPSSVVMGMTAAEPDSPSEVAALAPRSRTVRLRWASSASPEIVKYRIERAPAAQPTAFVKIAETTETEYLDGGTAETELRDSTDYVYRVTSINAVGAESKPMLSNKVTTLPPPKAVAGLKAEGDQVRCVPLSWDPSPEQDVVRYDIYRLDHGTGKFELISRNHGREQTGFLDGGANPGNLADNETYSYRVRAVNSVGAQSFDSETAQATTHAVPQRIEDVRAESGLARCVVVSWPESEDQSTIGYEIWCAPKGGEFEQVGRVSGRDCTSFTYRGETADPAGLGKLKDNAEYTFKIVEFNIGYVRSSASAPATAGTKPLPSTPAGLKATTSRPRSISLVWQSNPEDDIVHYVVESSERQDSGFEKLADVPKSRDAKFYFAHQTGLGDGEIRYFRVKAVDNDRLESSWSGVVEGVTKPAPDPPSALRVKKTVLGIRLMWNVPPQPDIREYVVWRKERFSWSLHASTRDAFFVFLKEDLGKPVVIRLTAIDNENLESKATDAVTIEYQE